MSDASAPGFLQGAIVDRDVAMKPSGRDDLYYVLAWSWLFPKRAAQRSAHWSLWHCFFVHIVTGLPGVFLLAAALFVFHASAAELLDQMGDIINEFRRYPLTGLLTLLGLFLIIESVHLGLAVVVVAWGGMADERLRDSFKHSLCQTWLRTPHAIVVAALVAAGMTTIQLKSEEWSHLHSNAGVGTLLPNWPIPPQVPPGDPQYAAAKLKYDQELAKYQALVAQNQKSWMQWRQTQPWYVRNDETLSVFMVLVGAAWWLVAMLSAVGVQRSLSTPMRSPLCLWCGYDLSMTPMESRCPECGEAVVQSLGDGAQPGAEWTRRQEKKLLNAWWATWREALRRPGAFGRSLRVFGQPRDHRRFLAIQLVPIFLLGAAGIVTLVYTTDGPTSNNPDVPEMILLGMNIGTVCTIGATLVACGVATIAGWIISLQNRRNLLPAAIQVAAYSSPYLVAWAFFGAVLINCFINLEMRGWLREASAATGLDRLFLFFLGVTLPNIICALIYIGLVARGTHGARYANR